MYILDSIPNLQPVVATGRDRRDLAQGPIHSSGDDEAAEIVEVIDIRGPGRNFTADSTCKTHNVDQDASTMAV